MEWRTTIRQRLEEFPHRDSSALQASSLTTQIPATVIIGVTEEGLGANVGGLPVHSAWSTAPAVLLTRRSAQLRNHPGQWAFPGGRVDAGETALQAGLRELTEEVGLTADPSHLLGRLDDFRTQSGWIMTPYVVWLGPANKLRINTDEVASAHRIPFTELLRPDAPRLSPIEDSEHPVLRMPVGNDSMAAPTAAILYQFAQVCLRGEHTRVDHFAQPHFARR